MSAESKPTILIVGAGLGGVMLGALLEKADIPYLIVERATTVKPLGSALAVGPSMVPVFEQLGIDKEYIALGKRARYSMFIKENQEELLALDYSSMDEFMGYPGFIVSRPAFYDLLLKQIPAYKVHFGKRVDTIVETNDKVKAHTSTGELFQGDILVGADGAYSSVRKGLYERLKKEGHLPQSDQEDLPFKCTCLVGQTEPLDLEVYPQLKDPNYPFYTTIGDDKKYIWSLFPTAGSKISWMLVEQLDAYTSRSVEEERTTKNAENVEWGPNAAQSMMDKTRGFPIHFGNGKQTLAEMYDKTPKDLISKVSLEEKIFETWSGGRTVLLGDACHKLNPAGGQGAFTAMQDAMTLANLFYAMPSNTLPEIQTVFSEYRAERYPAAVEAFNASQTLSMLTGKNFGSKVALFVAQNLPNFLWRLFVKKMVVSRSTMGFLKEIEPRGTVSPFESASAVKARGVYYQRKGSLAA
ncbi:hypothetical protein BG015_001878 [Linnemannia schmuckeri]|uniref:FAD-binding domain-containing protein n=1 Tax=Linnemannia schmuckeri TaxID=64567 RepID=A0A9P5V6S0_9FUNG|nr:hypothetical protein BG015_001878 [Linnemannia schmuckeri]